MTKLGSLRLCAAMFLFCILPHLTYAHSLGVATLGYLSVPAAPVEATVALSIVFLCTKIVHARQGRIGLTYSYPWFIAFAFGLLHGLGFAGALSVIGLPPSEIPIALLFLNVGVEAGQLLFIAGVFVLLAALKRLKPDFLHSFRMAPIYAIGTVSTF